ncbi:MAG: glycosyltransferase family 1 protein [Candidatus Sumerlaeia bacterium]|nr:glycosyltransferase family 1 protein [Candidatus Sumerlaeia bacterium]
MALTVGYDASASLGARTGIGRYTLELLRALVALREPDVEFVVLLNSLRREPGPEHRFLFETPGVRVVRRRLPGPAIVRGWADCGLPTWERLAGVACDVVHGPAGYLPPTRAPLVATVHDLSFLREPEGSSGALAGELFRRHWPRRLPQAAAVVTPSRFVAEDIAAAYPRLDPSRIHAIAHGADHLPPASPQPPAPGPYALAVAGAEPRKRTELLLSLWRDHGAGLPPLHIAGVAPRPESPPGVQFLPRLGDGELATWYAHAAVLVMTTREEGFGLPLLEAARHGVRTVCGRHSSLAEIGPGMAVFVSEDSAGGFAEAIRRALAAPRDGSVERAAAPFTWAEAARRTLAVYRSAAV